MLDESNLILSAGRLRKYHVVLRRRAHDLDSAWEIGFDTTMNRICGDFDSIVYRSRQGFSGRNSVRIASIRRISKEDHNDLLIMFGKKDPEIILTPVPGDIKGADVEELDPAATDYSSGN